MAYLPVLDVLISLEGILATIAGSTLCCIVDLLWLRNFKDLVIVEVWKSEVLLANTYYNELWLVDHLQESIGAGMSLVTRQVVIKVIIGTNTIFEQLEKIFFLLKSWFQSFTNLCDSN